MKVPKNGNNEVGYGKPPKDKQFKKGQSGNPKGRPKGSKNFSTNLREVLNSKVDITHGGKKKSTTTQDVALRTLKKNALTGNQRSLEKFLDLAERYGEQAEAQAEERKLSANEQAILDEFLDRQKADWEHERKAAEDAADKDDNPSDDDDEAWLR